MAMQENKDKQDIKAERTKVYLIIGLGVIFCLVGYFRFFHRSSNEATGTATAAQTTAPTVASLVVPATSLPPQGRDAQELFRQETIRDLARDIFEPGKSVQRKESKAKAPAEAAPRPVQLTLNGMVYSASKPVAIINGQFMRPGDQIGGYKVVSIGPKEVRMTGDDREMVLRVTDHERN
jgi:hypothetical protein